MVPSVSEKTFNMTTIKTYSWKIIDYQRKNHLGIHIQVKKPSLL